MSKQLTTFSRRPLAPQDQSSPRTLQPSTLFPDRSAPQGGHDFRAVSIAPPLQAKLTVNTPGDAYEQEADAVAAQVMSAPAEAAPVQREADEDELQMKPLDVSRVPQERGSVPVQTVSNGTAAEQDTDVSGVVSEGLSGGGQRLDNDTRSFMETRFGHDFSQVKIHTDSRASDSAQAVAARAYTVGGDIAFRSGEYNPTSSDGRALLAHELTHVVQQGAASANTLSRSGTADVQGDANPAVQRDGGVTAGLVLGAVAILQSQVNASNGGLSYSSDQMTYPASTPLVPGSATSINTPIAQFFSGGDVSNNDTGFNLHGDFGSDANGNPVMANVRIELANTTTYYTSLLSFTARALTTPSGTATDPHIQFSVSGRFDPAGPGDVMYAALFDIDKNGFISVTNARWTTDPSGTLTGSDPTISGGSYLNVTV